MNVFIAEAAVDNTAKVAETLTEVMDAIETGTYERSRFTSQFRELDRLISWFKAQNDEHLRRFGVIVSKYVDDLKRIKNSAAINSRSARRIVRRLSERSAELSELARQIVTNAIAEVRAIGDKS